MTLYSKIAIEKTIAWMDGDDHAKHWLQMNGHEELVQLKDASLNNSKAIEYLLVHKRFILAAFVNAIWEDTTALKLLMDKREFHWAAMASFINGDEKAATFLEKINLKQYAELASKIQAQIRKQNDKNSNLFNSGPYKV